MQAWWLQHSIVSTEVDRGELPCGGFPLTNIGRGKCRETPSETGHKLTVGFDKVMGEIVAV